MIGRLSVFAFCLTVSPAFATNALSWVSSTGNDNNACTRTSPCATFAGAILKTTAGGEIDVVDPGEYGPVNITQSVTIDGGGIARVHDVISINYEGTNLNVTLRNLSVKTVNIATSLFSLVVLDNLRIGGVDNTGGGVTFVGSPDGSVLEIRNTIISSGTGVTCAGETSTIGGAIFIDGSLLTGNSTAVTSQFFSCSVWLSNTTITANGTGLASLGGSITSFVNNRIFGNGTNGTPTQSIFQK